MGQSFASRHPLAVGVTTVSMTLALLVGTVLLNHMDRNTQTETVAAFRPRLQEYLAVVSQGGTKASPTHLMRNAVLVSSGGYFNGYELRYDAGRTEILLPSQIQGLNPALIAKKPADVGSVIWFKWSLESAGLYREAITDRRVGDGYRWICRIVVGDFVTKRTIAEATFRGGDPPFYGGGFRAGEPPWRAIVMYLHSLLVPPDR